MVNVPLYLNYLLGDYHRANQLVKLGRAADMGLL